MNPINSKPDVIQSMYWNGNLTRKEAQPIFDQFSSSIQALAQDIHGGAANGQDGLITILARLDFVTAFLMEKIGVSPAEFQEFMAKKTQEFLALQEAAKIAAEAPKPEEPSASLN